MKRACERAAAPAAAAAVVWHSPCATPAASARHSSAAHCHARPIGGPRSPIAAGLGRVSSLQGARAGREELGGPLRSAGGLHAGTTKLVGGRIGRPTKLGEGERRWTQSIVQLRAGRLQATAVPPKLSPVPIARWETREQPAGAGGTAACRVGRGVAVRSRGCCSQLARETWNAVECRARPIGPGMARQAVLLRALSPPPSPHRGSCCCPTDLAQFPGASAPDKLRSHTAGVDESRQGARDQGLLPFFWWPGWRAGLSRSLCSAAVQWPEAAL